MLDYAVDARTEPVRQLWQIKQQVSNGEFRPDGSRVQRWANKEEEEEEEEGVGEEDPEEVQEEMAEEQVEKKERTVQTSLRW